MKHLMECSGSQADADVECDACLAACDHTQAVICVEGDVDWEYWHYCQDCQDGLDDDEAQAAKEEAEAEETEFP